MLGNAPPPQSKPLSTMTDAEALDFALKHARSMLQGAHVVEINGTRSGKIVEVEIDPKILNVKSAAPTDAFNYVICHVWSGKELWESRANDLKANVQQVSN